MNVQELEAQAVKVRELEAKLAEKAGREEELFRRVEAMQKQIEVAAKPPEIVQTGCPGAPLPPAASGGGGRITVSGRCPLTEAVEELTRQMAEVMARLAALESIKMQPRAAPPAPGQKNAVGVRQVPGFPEEVSQLAVLPACRAGAWLYKRGTRETHFERMCRTKRATTLYKSI